jgi:hypothetical protein
VYTETLPQQPNSSLGARKHQAAPRRPLANRLPQRSLRQVFAVPLSGEGQAPVSDGTSPTIEYRKSEDGDSQVDVVTIPSSVRTCRHHLFVEDGTQLKKLDLPSTACVVVSQKFKALAGDTLSFDYVAILRSSNGADVDRPAVRAILVNRTAETAVSLMDRTVDGCSIARDKPTGATVRGSQSFSVPTSGDYELRFITLIDHGQPGSEAHLLVNSARVVNQSGQEVRRLASLSCVGRVH